MTYRERGRVKKSPRKEQFVLILRAGYASRQGVVATKHVSAM